MSTTSLGSLAAGIIALCLVVLVLNLTSRRFSAWLARNVEKSDERTREMRERRR